MTTTASRVVPASAVNRPRRRWAPYLLIAPTVVLIAAFLIYPIGSIFYYSLQHYNVTRPYDNGFAGLDNFRRMFTDDPLFWRSLRTTVLWVAVQVALQLVLGMLLALIVNERFRGRGLMRALIFSPWAVSGVLATGIWVLLYNPTTGAGHVLAELGIGSGDTAVLSQPTSAFLAVVLAELWRGVPFFAILILADLQTVSGDLYEAANVDGATRWQRFVHVTLPHLRGAIILTCLLRAVWEFNNVDLIYTMTGGGPANSTTTLPLYVARQALTDLDFGYGSALTVVSFLILLVFSVVFLRTTKYNAEKD
jgi:multiple sugar transport system permease protein